MRSHVKKFASPSVEAAVALFESIETRDLPLATKPSVENLLAYTHALSNSLSNTLGSLVRIIGTCDEESRAQVTAAIDSTTDSITTARCLMIEFHYLRRQMAVK